MAVESMIAMQTGFELCRVEEKDVDAVLAVINAASQAAMGINEMTRDELLSFWGTPGMDRAEDLRMVRTADGRVIAYAESETLDQPPVHPYIWMRIHPDFQDDCECQVLMDWAIQRARRVLHIVPEDLRVSIHAHNPGQFAYGQALLEANGFQVIRHSLIMYRDFEQAPQPAEWPQGIALRPFDPARHAEAVYRADREIFADHFGHMDEPFEQGFAKFQHDLQSEKFDASLWFVAMDGDQIAGFSLCRLNHQEAEPMGWVGVLGVRRPWRKRGLGVALLQHSFDMFYQRGFRRVGLGVDAGNLTGALRLYRRVGMYTARQWDRYEKELRPGKELMVTELESQAA